MFATMAGAGSDYGTTSHVLMPTINGGSSGSYNGYSCDTRKFGCFIAARAQFAKYDIPKDNHVIIYMDKGGKLHDYWSDTVPGLIGAFKKRDTFVELACNQTFTGTLLTYVRTPMGGCTSAALLWISYVAKTGNGCIHKNAKFNAHHPYYIWGNKKVKGGMSILVYGLRATPTLRRWVLDNATSVDEYVTITGAQVLAMEPSVKQCK